MEDYCTICHVCVHKCPVEAILAEPQRHENGQISYVINERCFPYFSDYYGCSVCIAVCPFNHTAYETLKKHIVTAGGEARASAQREGSLAADRSAAT